ncbi:hypothetical protein [Ruegeria jejuensis]|uniref:hypothetical protein n=1 Tax=Ruegeria jejuensis TaxID=3233338 RepID=UPI00355C50A5
MTDITTEPGQTRLDSCVLALPTWAKIQEKLRKRVGRALKADGLVADTAVRVENVHENGQASPYTMLLGKCVLEMMRQAGLDRRKRSCIDLETMVSYPPR